MPSTLLRELIPVLQEAIAPVILISGVGLLLLSLTNRFGRAVDRSRQLAKEMRGVSKEEQAILARQVDILFRRAKLIRLSIILATTSLLLAALLIIGLFLTALLKLEMGLLIALIFMGCMLSLIFSLITFIQDIHLSLIALRLELGQERD
jgi:hypothetical protein